MQIRAFFISTSLSLPNLNKKEKAKWVILTPHWVLNPYVRDTILQISCLCLGFELKNTNQRYLSPIWAKNCYLWWTDSAFSTKLFCNLSYLLGLMGISLAGGRFRFAFPLSVSPEVHVMFHTSWRSIIFDSLMKKIKEEIIILYEAIRQRSPPSSLIMISHGILR